MKKLNFLLVLLLMVFNSCDTNQVIDFNDLSSLERIPFGGVNPVPVNIGDQIFVGDVLHDKKTDTYFDVRHFRYQDGSPNGEGFVQIEASKHTGGSGYEVHFDNATLWVRAKVSFDIKEIDFKYADLGGNINLVDNSTWYYDDNFEMIPSPTIPGGMTIKVTQSNNKGTIHLSGKIDKIKFPGPILPREENFPKDIYYIAVVGGGQELWIDDIILIK
jgi:hypothetical protein